MMMSVIGGSQDSTAEDTIGHQASGRRTPLESWVELFTAQGYAQVESREIEPGFEKIAIFVDLKDMMPSHVTKSDGRVWKSKLGKGQDIEHASLDVLEGDQADEYGIVELVLRRPLGQK